LIKSLFSGIGIAVLITGLSKKQTSKYFDYLYVAGTILAAGVIVQANAILISYIKYRWEANQILVPF
jgi:hypothetical protein